MRRFLATALLGLILSGTARAAARTGSLIDRLKTASGDGRIGTIRALGRIGSRKAVPALVEAWRNSAAASPVRGAIAKALSRIGGKEARGLLLESLNERDDEVLQAVIRGLGELKEKRAVDSLIKLSRSGGGLAKAAYEALGLIGDKKALSAVRAGLAAEKTLDKIPAAYALARLSKEEGEELLEAFMEPGPEGDAPAVLAAYYLARLDKDSGLDYLTMMLGADHNPAQPLAIEALGQAGNPKAVLILSEALGAEDPAVRLMVARALGRLGGRRAASALKQAENDADPGVRAAVKAALVELGEGEE